ncbi:protein MpDIR26 [Marchantia polymorpha subsp. ruderalis]
MVSSPVFSVILFATLLFSFSGSYAFGPSHSPPSLLVNFEFENRVPPNNTVVVSATPSGNLSVSEFGTVRVVTNVIRQSLNQDSKVLGKVVGLVNSLKDGSIYLTFDFVYETRRLNGTIGMQGRLNAQGNGELEVTGGTGTFRFARGYCITTTQPTEDPSKLAIFKNVIHLRY